MKKNSFGRTPTPLNPCRLWSWDLYRPLVGPAMYCAASPARPMLLFFSGWRLLLRPKQQVDVVRHGAGHGSPRLLLLVHHPLPPQHHRLLGLLVHVQDGEVQLQCELYKCGLAPQVPVCFWTISSCFCCVSFNQLSFPLQGEPPRLNVQEHKGGRLRDPPHQLRPLFLILRQRPTLQECRLQLLIQHLEDMCLTLYGRKKLSAFFSGNVKIHTFLFNGLTMDKLLQ